MARASLALARAPALLVLRSAATSLTISTDAVDHVNNPLWLGAHLDEGYAQIPWHWTRNIVFGQSFEKPSAYAVYSWTDASDASATGSARLDNTTWLNEAHKAPSLLLNFTGGVGQIGWANRGMGGEGLWVQGGSPYEGFLWVLAPGGAALAVSLRPRGGGSPFASAALTAASSPDWQRLNFTITPSETSVCDTIAAGSDPTVDCGVLPPVVGTACVRCSAEFVVGLTAPGTARVGFVDLGPGEWGSVTTLSKRTLDVVREMGITVVRMGGSVGATIRWKDWRGTPWTRAAMQAEWTPGVSIAPLSPFEFVDAMRLPGVDILPIVTFSAELNSVADWGDLVDYCYGDETTTWGAVRIHNDSHPAPFDLAYFELGNEQQNPQFAQQVIEMEARRKAVGAPPFTYLYPSNSGVDNATATALVSAGVAPEAIAPDCHATDGPSCELSSFGRLPWFNQSGMTCEVNGRLSDMNRAVMEGRDLSRWFNAPAAAVPRLRGRMTSFVTMRSGHFEHSNAYQGISYSLPNMSWIMPPGYVHSMISKTWAPNALRVTVAGAGAGADELSASAQLSADGSRLVVQLTNAGNSSQATAVDVQLVGGAWAPSGAVGVWTLREPVAPGVAPNTAASNAPGSPTFIAPALSNVTWPGGATANLTVALPPYSFTVLEVFGAAT